MSISCCEGKAAQSLHVRGRVTSAPALLASSCSSSSCCGAASTMRPFLLLATLLLVGNSHAHASLHHLPRSLAANTIKSQTSLTHEGVATTGQHRHAEQADMHVTSHARTLTSTMKPGITKTTSDASAAAHATLASNFSSILQYVQVIRQGAQVLVKVGLPPISPNFLINAALVYKADRALHERLLGPPVTGASAFQPLLRDAKTAKQAYNANFTTATNCTAYLAGILNASTIVDCSTVSAVNRQPYFAYVEHDTRRVVVSIRGSDAVLDWTTNENATAVVIAPTVGAHKGMFASAEQLLGRTATKLNAVLAASPGYTLTFIGHSLGAGVGALAAYMVKNSVSQGSLLSAAAPGVSAACFSTPPVLTMDAAASAQAYITTLLTEDDVVPRASLGNVNSVIVRIDTRNSSPLAQKAPTKKITIDLNYSSHKVSPSISTGTEVLYQMYAPGTMLQLTSAGSAAADDSCLGPMLSGKGVNDRLKTIYLKANMVNDHSLAKMIRCLTAHLS